MTADLKRAMYKNTIIFQCIYTENSYYKGVKVKLTTYQNLFTVSQF